MIIEQTDIWTIDSIQNGLAYSIYHKPSAQESFLQGDDAAQWRSDYDAMRAAYANSNSAWFNQSWNNCLAQICADYLES